MADSGSRALKNQLNSYDGSPSSNELDENRLSPRKENFCKLDSISLEQLYISSIFVVFYHPYSHPDEYPVYKLYEEPKNEADLEDMLSFPWTHSYSGLFSQFSHLTSYYQIISSIQGDMYSKTVEFDGAHEYTIFTRCKVSDFNQFHSKSDPPNNEVEICIRTAILRYHDKVMLGDVMEEILGYVTSTCPGYDREQIKRSIRYNWMYTRRPKKAKLHKSSQCPEHFDMSDIRTHSSGDSSMVSTLISTFGELARDKPYMAGFFSQLESLALYIIACREQTTTTGLTTVSALYLKNVIGDNQLLFISVFEFLRKVLGVVSNVTLFSTDDVQTMSKAGIMYSYLMNHSLTKHVCTLASLAVTLNFVQPQAMSIGRFELYNIAALEHVKSCKDIFEVVFESVGFFFDHAVQYFRTGDPTTIFKASDPYSTVVNNIAYLSAHMSDLKLGNYTTQTGFPEQHFITMLTDTLDLITGLTPNRYYSPQTISNYLSTLRKMRSQLATYIVSAKLRVAPFGLLLYGKSEVGKSSLTTYLAKAILKYNGFAYEDKHFCTLDPLDDFQPNMRSDTTCIVYDDVGNAKISGNSCPDTSIIIQCVNNTYAYANMPEANDKGKVVMNHKVFVATTNVKDMNASLKSNEPLSIVRRLPYVVTVKVNPRYANSSGKLSQRAIESDPLLAASHIKDVWLLTLERVIAKPGLVNGPENFGYTIVTDNNNLLLKDVGLVPIVKFLQHESKLHFDSQKRLIDELEALDKTAPECPMCKAYKMFCMCPAPPQPPPRNDGGDNGPPGDPRNDPPDQSGPHVTLPDVIFCGSELEDIRLENVRTRLSRPNLTCDSNCGPHFSDRTVSAPFTGADVLTMNGRNTFTFNRKYNSKFVFLGQYVLDDYNQFQSASTGIAGAILNGVMKRTSFSTIFNDALASLAKHTVTTIRNTMSNWAYTAKVVLQPSPIEEILAGTASIPAKIHAYYSLQKGPFYWTYSWLPDFIVDNPAFDGIYSYLERRAVLRTFYRWSTLINCGGLYGIYRLAMYNSSVTNVPKYPLRSFCGIAFGLLFLTNAAVLKNVSALVTQRLYDDRQLRDIARVTNNMSFTNRVAAKGCNTIQDIRRYLRPHRRRIEEVILTATALTALAGGTYTVYKFLKYMKNEWICSEGVVQSELSSPDGAHIASRDGRKNVWLTPTSMTVTPGTRTSPELVNSISSSVVHAKFRYEDGTEGRSCNMVFVHSNFAIVPFHIFRKDKNYETDDDPGVQGAVTVDITVAPIMQGGIERTGTVIKGRKIRNWFRIDQTDLAMIYVNVGPRKTIYPLFATTNDYTGNYASVKRNAAGFLVKSSGWCRPFNNGVYSYHERFVMPALHTVHEDAWIDGDCMTTLVTCDANPRVIGFHLIGSKSQPDNGIAMVLTASRCSEMINSLDRASYGLFNAGPVSDVPTTVCGRDIGFVAVHNHSPFEYVHKHVTNPLFTSYGVVKGGVSPTSSYRDSIISDTMCAVFDISKRWGPPPFAPKNERGVPEKWRPWEAGLIEWCDPTDFSDYDALNWACIDWLEPLEDRMKQYREFDVHRPLTNFETLNGIPGKRFIDKMNFKTSMGFPINAPKINFLHETEDGMDFIDPIYWSEVAKCETKYLAGETCSFIYQTFLKDEALPKVGSNGKPKKARIVLAAPIVAQLMLRKYYLPILRFLSSYPLESEVSVGINPFSMEWGELIDHLLSVDPSCTDMFAGDYSAWDKRVPATIVASALKCLNRLAEVAGYSVDELTILKGLATDLLFPLVNYNGTLVRFWSGVVSGHTLTSFLNCTVNALLLRCMFHHLIISSGGSLIPFRNAVHTAFYGDDVLGVVHPAYKPIFNFTTFQKCLKSVVGMTFTLPSKLEGSVLFLPFEETDFLKRITNVLDEVLVDGTPVKVGKLSIDSIYKSLMCVNGRTGDEKNLISAITCSALHEMFYHGRAAYEDFLSKMSLVLKEHQISCPDLSTTYDQRISLWHENYDSDGTIEFLSNNNSLTPFGADDLLLHSSCTGYHIPKRLSTGKINNPGLLGKDLNLHFVEGLISADLQPPNNLDNDINKCSARNLEGEEQTSESYDIVCHSGSTGIESPVNGGALMSFDIVPGTTDHLPVIRDETFDQAITSEADIRQFFSRPVKLNSWAWNVDDDFAVELDPLRRLILNDRNVNRLNNYSWFTGTLCLKLVINGTSFHYGRLVMAADYYPEYDTVMANYGTISLTQLLQLPYIAANPTDASGGCLEIPLVYPYNMIPFDEDAFSDIVRLHIRTLNPLKVVNVMSDAPLRIDLWGWFKDIRLAMPTQFDTIITQSATENDEYDEKFSTKATTLAKSIMSLGSAPYIGKYARASSIAVGLAGSVAKLFGYTKPSVIPEHKYVINQPAGNICNVNCCDVSTKLGFDAKNEVTVDTSVTGYSDRDEMTITSIGSKEGWLCSMLWTPSSAALFVMNINPILCKRPNIQANARLIMPCTHAALPFKYWRGTMKVRVEVVASAMHKGKVRIVYDPFGKMEMDGVGWTDQYNLNYSHVIDISESRDYTFKVGWATNKNYLLTTDLTRSNWSNDILLPPLGADSNYSFNNGRLGIHPLVPLTSISADTPPAYINIFVSMEDDFEVAVPRCNGISDWSTNAPLMIGESDDLIFQSAIDDVPGGPMVPGAASAANLVNDCSQINATLNEKLELIHLGESIVSIRQLIKRYCNNGVWPLKLFEAEITSGGGLARFRFPNFPSYGGYSTSPNPYMFQRNELSYNYATFCNWITWYAPAYLMYRGSTRFKYYLKSSNMGDTVTSMSVHYSPNDDGLYYIGQSVPDDLLIRAAVGSVPFENGFNGMLLNDHQVCKLHSVEVPYQSNKRWFFAQNRNVEDNTDPWNRRSIGAHSITICFRDIVEASGVDLWRYTAAGDDFSFSMYKYTPLVFYV